MDRFCAALERLNIGGDVRKLGLDDFRDPLRRRRIAATAGNRYLTVNDDHADAGNIAHLNTFQQVFASGVLGAVEEYEIGGAAFFDQCRSRDRASD